MSSTEWRIRGVQSSAAGWDLFLSYQSRDREAVLRISELLKARGVKTFVDREQLAAGLPWPQALESALGKVRAVAIFLSGDDLGSWQKREVGFALDRQAQEEAEGQAFPVIPVLLPGADPAPRFLFLNTWVDLRQDPLDVAGLEVLVRAAQGEVAPTSGDHLAICPYRGLQVFREEHAAFFFGREAFVDQLTRAIERANLVTVIGPSGSGKSSVVQAGLVPRLRRRRPPAGTWDVVVFTPNDRPFERLAAGLIPLLEPSASETDRLAEAHKLANHLADATVPLASVVERLLTRSSGTDRLMLVVDQFEELFTIASESARLPFVNALLEALDKAPLTLLLTLRADFYGHAIALDRTLSDRIGPGAVNLGPMRWTELERAITEPAWKVGLSFEPQLVETILGDLADQPGALPLLEHALLELWERRQSGRLTLAAYRASGGVAGAIAQRAEALYERFDPAEQDIARRVLLRLTRPGQGTEDTRRRATLGELVTRAEDRPAVERVVSRLADARLLTTDVDPGGGEAWVDVAHEALIRGWARLEAWIDEDRESLQILRKLTDASREWEQAQRDESLLYRGARLASALEWRERNEQALNDREREFLDASVLLQRRERHSAQTRVRRTIAGLAVALVLIFGFAVFSLIQFRDAVQQREFADRQRVVADQQRSAAERAATEAIHQQRIATSRELSTTAAGLWSTDPELSLLLALEAVKAAPTTQADVTLRSALFRSRLRMVLRGHTAAVLSVAVSPDGQRIVSAGEDGTTRVWGTTTGNEVLQLHGHAGAVYSAAFSADGTRLVTAGKDSTARVWDSNTGAESAQLRGHIGVVNSAAFSPDGEQVVTAGQDSTVRIWDAHTGRELDRLESHGGWVYVAAFNRNGDRIISGSIDGTARIWDSRTHTELGQLRLQNVPIYGAAFSPDGQRVVTAGGDGVARVWDASTYRELVQLRGHTDQVRSAAFSPDGKRVITASQDATTRVWDATTGDELWELLPRSLAQSSAAFIADGKLAVTGGGDGNVRVWATIIADELQQLRGHRGWLNSASFSPDGHRVVTAGDDGTSRVWDADAGGELVQFWQSNAIHFSAAFSPDGGRVVTASNDNTAIVWDAGTARDLLQLRGHTGPVVSAAFSPDGKRLLTMSSDDTARVWDAETGAALLELRSEFLRSAAFSPDGTRVITTNGEPSAKVWDSSSGQLIREFRLPDGVSTANFSPDGQRLVTTNGALFVSDTGTARVWDFSSGRQIALLFGRAGAANDGSFSPDSQRLVTTGGSTPRVWDVSTGQEILDLFGHSDTVHSAAFSPDGQRIVTASFDGTARVWGAGCELGCTLDELQRFAQTRVTRDLTPQERDQYLPDSAAP